MKALVVNLAKALFGTLGIKALVPLARLLWRYAVATWRVLLRPVLRVLLPPALVAGVVWGLNQPIPEAIKRDVLLALKAHQLAGELVPFDPDYIESRVYDPDQTWGMTTNSRWLLDTTLRIVPMFEYERMAGTARYPSKAFFAPLLGARSLLVAGTVPSMTPPIVVLNERLFSEPLWDDEASALSVLVHELVHVQGGNFIKAPSEFLESHTTAAATEILAGMCNYGDEIACRAFWGDIEGLARGGLFYRLYELHASWAYEAFADLFLRDAIKERQADKIDRFWEGHLSERMGIVEKYGAIPSKNSVLAGLS